MRNPGLAVVACLVLAVLDGCTGSDQVVAPVPANLTIASGNNQSGQIGTTLPVPLKVSVTSSGGTGIADVTVDWAVTSGGGTLSAATTFTDADGNTSVNWTLGSSGGTQSVAAIVTSLASASFSATAVAPPQTVVLHYNGTAWSTSLETPDVMRVSLSAIWGSSPSQIFAVGRCTSSTLTLLFGGNTWNQPPSSCASSGSLSEFTGVSGISGADVFRVGRAPLPPSFNGWVDHYDGQTWTEVYRKSCSFCGGLRAIWSGAHNDAVAVGDAGEIRRYDGTNWNLQTGGTTNNLNAVWGFGTSSVFAAGDGGTIIYYNGSSWVLQPSGSTQPLNAIWGTSSTNVFAVGEGGTILHYDGSAWTAQSSGSTMALRGVWGSSGSSVFAVGNGNTVLFYNGTTWTAQNANAAINLRAVWGTSATNVFAVGSSY